MMETILHSYVEKFQSVKGFFTGDKKKFRFFASHFENRDPQDVLLKIKAIQDPELALSQTYEPMVSNIISLPVDEMLTNEDLKVVEKLGELNVNGDKKMFYTFASTFCSFHKPDSYPIYNTTLVQILILFNEKSDADAASNEAFDYPDYTKEVDDFRKSHGLGELSFWELNKLVFIYGREILTARKQSMR